MTSIKSPRLDRNGKAERALELREQGLTPTQIAARIGSNPRSIAAMINAARKRRDQKAQEIAGA